VIVAYRTARMNAASVFSQRSGRHVVAAFCFFTDSQNWPHTHPATPLDQRGAASFGQPSPCCRNTTRVERIGVGAIFCRWLRGDFRRFGFSVSAGRWTTVLGRHSLPCRNPALLRECIDIYSSLHCGHEVVFATAPAALFNMIAQSGLRKLLWSAVVVRQSIAIV
jgi:hypothetical protein